MLNSVAWAEDRSYRTGSPHEPIQFYLDALSNSKSLDLLLGYFSSAAINVLSLGFAKFLSSGGQVRLVVNEILSQNDKNAVIAAESGIISDNTYDLSDVITLKETLDEYGKHFFDCLSWLIYNKKIEIIIIKPKQGSGISHYKSGVFRDGVNSVGFKASCNFTAYGLLENLEEIDAFLTWENGRSNKWINSQTKYFENIFNKKADFVDYLKPNQIKVAITDQFNPKSIDELLINEQDLINKKKATASNIHLKNTIEKLNQEIEELVNTPKFPFLLVPVNIKLKPMINGLPKIIKAYLQWLQELVKL